MLTVVDIKPEEGYRLKVKLSNGKSGYFEISPYLEKGIFRERKDPNYFKLAKPVFGGVGCPHGQDFSADTIEYELQPISKTV